MMEEVLDFVTEKQKQNQIKQQDISKKQIQALHDSSQLTTQAIQGQTKAIQESSNALDKNQLITECKSMMKSIPTINMILSVLAILT